MAGRLTERSLFGLPLDSDTDRRRRRGVSEDAIFQCERTMEEALTEIAKMKKYNFARALNARLLERLRELQGGPESATPGYARPRSTDTLRLSAANAKLLQDQLQLQKSKSGPASTAGYVRGLARNSNEVGGPIGVLTGAAQPLVWPAPSRPANSGQQPRPRSAELASSRSAPNLHGRDRPQSATNCRSGGSVRRPGM
jgi:hypothetical protein